MAVATMAAAATTLATTHATIHALMSQLTTVSQNVKWTSASAPPTGSLALTLLDGALMKF